LSLFLDESVLSPSSVGFPKACTDFTFTEQAIYAVKDVRRPVRIFMWGLLKIMEVLLAQKGSDTQEISAIFPQIAPAIPGC